MWLHTGVCEQTHSFYASLRPAIQQQKLLSSPGFGFGRLLKTKRGITPNHWFAGDSCWYVWGRHWLPRAMVDWGRVTACDLPGHVWKLMLQCVIFYGGVLIPTDNDNIHLSHATKAKNCVAPNKLMCIIFWRIVFFTDTPRPGRALLVSRAAQLY